MTKNNLASNLANSMENGLKNSLENDISLKIKSSLKTKLETKNDLKSDLDSTITAKFVAEMQTVATSASGLLKSLSHPDRLKLLSQLAQGEYCVTELEQRVGVGQPSLSQQLGILRKEKLVSTRRVGQQIYYSLISEDVLAILLVLHGRLVESL